VFRRRARAGICSIDRRYAQRMELDAPDAQDRCPNCGKPAADWTENDGSGVISGGLTYCSQACAIEDAARQQED
jgi:hypothetical protein